MFVPARYLNFKCVNRLRATLYIKKYNTYTQSTNILRVNRAMSKNARIKHQIKFHVRIIRAGPFRGREYILNYQIATLDV